MYKRQIVYGVGAIGGTIAAGLALAGKDVVGIARGAHLAAIRASGLLFRTPDGAERVSFACHGEPSKIAFTSDDVIILTMKSHDTLAALHDLRDAGVTTQPIVCIQNGVANERMALRLFPNVYGATVMCPGSHTVPGEVTCFATPKRGLIDIGRYPSGRDPVAERIASALDAGGFDVLVLAEVMRSKHGKLLDNQANILEAALGPGIDNDRFHAMARAEGERVYRAAGIEWIEISSYEKRRKGVADSQPVDGAKRSGGSSTQSLARGKGSIETDYLNGEIVLLGRLHGVPTPISVYLCALAQRLARDRLPPGSITPEELERGFSGT